MNHSDLSSQAKVSTPFECTKIMDLHPEKHTDSGIISIISVVYDIYQGLFKRDRELDDAIDTAEQRLPPSLPPVLLRCPPKCYILAGTATIWMG